MISPPTCKICHLQIGENRQIFAKLNNISPLISTSFSLSFLYNPLMVVFVDVLLLLNFYVTAVLFKATALFLHEKISTNKWLFASLLGGLSSLLIFFNSPLLPLAKVCVGVFLVFVAFGYQNAASFISRAAVFIIINCVFAGITLLIWLFFAPNGMMYGAGYVYFDITMTTLIISTLVSYLTVSFFRKFLDKPGKNQHYEVKISVDDKSATLLGLSDSGNGAKDVFSGLPLVIVNPTALLPLFDLDYPLSSLGARLTPYKTVGNFGSMVVLKAKQILINDKPVDALIGVAKENIENADCIFNPNILI